MGTPGSRLARRVKLRAEQVGALRQAGEEGQRTAASLRLQAGDRRRELASAVMGVGEITQRVS